MFLIPTGTDRESDRRPIVVPLLVFACVAAFILTPSRGSGADSLMAYADFIYRWGVSYEEFSWWQPITYQFLHGGFFHLLFNGLFLAAFGLVLEQRLGSLGFLVLFLAGGAFAGLAQSWIGHWLAADGLSGPAIGASGSVSALMGAVFALHPRANVRGIAIPQFAPAQTSVQWMIGFAVALDIARTIVDFAGGNSGIATLAHLGGMVFGFAVGVLLLALGVVRRDDVDALFLFKQWRRRREMRAAFAQAGLGGDGPVLAGRVRADAVGVESESQRTLRNTIAAAHRERDYVLAADLYVELLGQSPEATLPAGIQLDVANQLAQSGRDAQAARAYERFLDRFRTHVAADDVRLMLAAIQVRRLADRSAARATLDGFAGRELDRERQALANALRAECGN
jgi:membrane associated rhomboid family serine protease